MPHVLLAQVAQGAGVEPALPTYICIVTRAYHDTDIYPCKSIGVLLRQKL